MGAYKNMVYDTARLLKTNCAVDTYSPVLIRAHNTDCSLLGIGLLTLIIVTVTVDISILYLPSMFVLIVITGECYCV